MTGNYSAHVVMGYDEARQKWPELTRDQFTDILCAVVCHMPLGTDPSEIKYLLKDALVTEFGEPVENKWIQ